MKSLMKNQSDLVQIDFLSGDKVMAYTSLLFPYGLRNGVLTHIDDVSRGLACECVCPACDAKLVARKGQQRIPHFAHARGEQCSYGLETGLHLAAKEILNEKREIVLPPVLLRSNCFSKSTKLAEEKRYKLDEVILEKKIGKIIPDVIGYVQEHPVLIEICVTHPVDFKKLCRIKDLGYSAIEIDLSNISRNLSRSELEYLIIEPGSHKKWIHNVFAERKEQSILESGKKFHTVRRGLTRHVDGCPIGARVWRGKPYANVAHDCIDCKYALRIEPGLTAVTCSAVSRRS
jgi:hypothetical protein